MNGTKSHSSSFFAYENRPQEPDDSFLGSHKVLHVTKDKKIINVALLGHKIPSHRKADLLPRPPSGWAAVEGVAEHKEVTQNELDRLSHLWHDKRLGLSNTKWPIPTHLAYLATKRAQLHLTFDNFDGKDDTAPCMLRPIHEDVKDTLYFM